MKIAITSTGNTMDSMIDSRFGRCAYFAIYDSETKEVEFVENPNKKADGGAGPASVKLVASYQVERVISQEFGIKIKSLFNDLNITMIILQEDKTINDIISLLNK